MKTTQPIIILIERKPSPQTNYTLGLDLYANIIKITAIVVICSMGAVAVVGGGGINNG